MIRARLWLRMATFGDRSSSLLGELAAHQQRDLHRVEVARRDDILKGLHARGISVPADGILPAAVIERERDGEPGGFDAQARPAGGR